MSKIYITGGAGFVGTNLCQLLSSHQKKFFIIDLKSSARFPEKTRIADIRNVESLKAALSDISPDDTIIHLAAVHRDDVRDKNIYQSTNVDGTKNVCEVASYYGVKKIIFTSSVAVYGFAPRGTGEDGEVNPFNEYGRTKYEGEQILDKWKSEDINRTIFIVRPTVIFGPGNRGTVFNLLNQINSTRFIMIGSGENRKSMAYVENVAEFLHCATSKNDGPTIVNYVDEPDLTMRELVALVRYKLKGKSGTGSSIPFGIGLILGYIADFISNVTGKKLPVSSIRVRKFCADSSFSSSKSKVDGFSPPFSLREGLEKTIDAEFISQRSDMEVFYTE